MLSKLITITKSHGIIELNGSNPLTQQMGRGEFA